MNRKVVYPGTFDPITNGHVNIVERAAALFDEVIVGVAKSADKRTVFDITERQQMVSEALAHINNVSVSSFDNLLVEFATSNSANVIVRGLRAVSDFEFECQLAGINRQLNAEIETLFLTPKEKEMFISSSLVREIAAMKGDITSFVPNNVVMCLEKKFR